MTITNKITRKGTLILLISALVITGLFSYPKEAWAGQTVLSDQVYFHLDMGVQLAYDGVNWADRGYNLGDRVTPSSTAHFDQNVEVIAAYPLKSVKGSRFDFDGDSSTTNIPDNLKRSAGNCANAYETYYKLYTTTSMNSNGQPVARGNEITFSYSAELNTSAALEAVRYGFDDRAMDIWRLFGGKNNVSDPKVEAAIESALAQGAAGTAGDNRLYLIFCPTVIEYKKYIAVADLEASLSLPATAKQGEEYSAEDISVVDSSLTIDRGLLEKRTDGGPWQTAALWPGTGEAGENTGGIFTEKSEEICVVDYRLTVTATGGQTDSDMKTINITDGRQMEGRAKLLLAEYTYEGHPTPAEDDTYFSVDKTAYSPTRAYSQGIASNRFAIVQSGAGSVRKLDSTRAEYTFPKKGNYTGKLTVSLKDGQVLTDVKPIEVRKTPYLQGSLSGFQKQNRRQVLNLQIATYPGKPLTDWHIIIKDRETGENIRLSKDSPQANSGNIKTRAVTKAGDEYWTNLTLEFLTKIPDYTQGNRQFEYTVWVMDSKNDTDSGSDRFTVVPDMPPVPEITVAKSFIRKAGSNTADIITEDTTKTDDQTERAWSVIFSDTKAIGGGPYRAAESILGYKALAFGSDQKIQFNKEGVGAVRIKLRLKDVWNEPTLPEYITESDYLTGEGTEATEVANLAPRVSIEPVSTKKANVIILAERASMAAVSARADVLKGELIGQGIDANIKTLMAPEDNGKTYSRGPNYDWHTAYGCDICGEMGYGGDHGWLGHDSQYVYAVESSQKQASQYTEVCIGQHAVRAVGMSGTAWNYTVMEPGQFDIAVDSSEKYVYIRCKSAGKTIVLNHDTGAYVTTIDLILPTNRPFMSGDGKRLYFHDGNAFKKYELEGGKLTTVTVRPGSLARLEKGKIAFVGSESAQQFYVGHFDMDTELVEEKWLPRLDLKDGLASPRPSDFDAGENVVFTQTSTEGSYGTIGLWFASAESGKASGPMVTSAYRLGFGCGGYAKDELGNAKAAYLMYGVSGRSDYRNLYVYKLGEDKMPEESRLVSSVSADDYLSFAPMAYAGYHSDDGKLYFIQNSSTGFYLNGSGGSWYKGLALDVDPVTWQAGDGTSLPWAGSYLMEKTHLEYNRMSRAWNMDYFKGSSGRVEMSELGITGDEASAMALLKHGKFGNERNIVLDLRETAKNSSLPMTESLALEDRAMLVFAGEKDPYRQIWEAVKEDSEQEYVMLKLSGDNPGSIAMLEKPFALTPGESYEYSYNMLVPQGSAVNIFSAEAGKEPLTQEQSLVEGIVAGECNYGAGQASPFFKTSATGWGLDYEYGMPKGIGSGYYNTGRDPKASYPFSLTVSFTMEKQGYVEYDFFERSSQYGTSLNYVTMDGVVKAASSAGESASGRKRAELGPGAHSLVFSASAGRNDTAWMGLSYIKAVYSGKSAPSAGTAEVSGEMGKLRRVEGHFEVKNIDAVCTELPDISAAMETFASGGVTELAGILSITGTADFNPAGRSVSMYSQRNYNYMYATFTAPRDKDMLITYDWSAPNVVVSGRRDNTQYPKLGNAGRDLIVLKRGQSHGIVLCAGKRQGAGLSNIRYAFCDLQGRNASGYMSKGEILDVPSGRAWIWVDGASARSEGVFKMKKLSPPTVDPKEVALQIKWQGSGEALISEFSIRSVNGIKSRTILHEPMNSIENLGRHGFKMTAEHGGGVDVTVRQKPEKEEEAPLVYKKGELVAYGINYSDYENDPSKRGGWIYVHTPFNDGPHQEAAVVLDEDGNVAYIGGKPVTDPASKQGEEEAVSLAKERGLFLNAFIPRFYTDGKYTVYHWQEDNTARNEFPKDADGRPVGNPDYDKPSNLAELTFYVEGGATAPWITEIFTEPGEVKESEGFKILVGVEDLEKDVLSLTTEVYKEKKLIYTHRARNILAGSGGAYPRVCTDELPGKAEAGSYEVVCTVRDKTGAGLGTYRFSVISRGKITGRVSHTDKWDDNRKRYNLSWFKDEINRALTLGQYLDSGSGKVVNSGSWEKPRERGTNVFWPGEKFILKADVAGKPAGVTCQIKGTEYKGHMKSTGSKNASGETIYAGAIWDAGMINKWGNREPMELTFEFTAAYSGGRVKKHEVSVIVDNLNPYWRLHRVF